MDFQGFGKPPSQIYKDNFEIGRLLKFSMTVMVVKLNQYVKNSKTQVRKYSLVSPGLKGRQNKVPWNEFLTAQNVPSTVILTTILFMTWRLAWSWQIPCQSCRNPMSHMRALQQTSSWVSGQEEHSKFIIPYTHNWMHMILEHHGNKLLEWMN